MVWCGCGVAVGAEGRTGDLNLNACVYVSVHQGQEIPCGTIKWKMSTSSIKSGDAER